VDAAGIHVVAGAADDFLLDCHFHRELESDLHRSRLRWVRGGRESSGTGDRSRRARRLYGSRAVRWFDEMVGEVEAERGALPLLAFAMSRAVELPGSRTDGC